jgi:hypothetical protein
VYSSRIGLCVCPCARVVGGSLGASKQADRTDGARRLARVGRGDRSYRVVSNAK